MVRRSLRRLRDSYREHGPRWMVRRLREGGLQKLFSILHPSPIYGTERPVPPEEQAAFVATVSGCSEEEARRARVRLFADGGFRDRVRRRLDRTAERDRVRLERNWREMLATTARITDPDLAVETGILDGLSAAYMLHGLDGGRLVSIDTGDTAFLPSDLPEAEVGWAVPDGMREGWERRIGDSREELPAVAEEHDIDMFLHDSRHTGEVMRSEFRTALAAMPAGAVFLSDDIDQSEAFADARSHLAASATVRKGRGMLLSGRAARLGGGRVAEDTSEELKGL